MLTVERIVPVLVYEDVAAAHDFLIQAFGFVSGGVHRTTEGVAVHGEVRAGESPIWLHRVTAEHQLDSARASNAASSGLFVYVDDVDAHCERARAAGARIDSEPANQPYGQ